MANTTTDTTCANACENNCTDGTRVKRVEYPSGRVDYLTIQCACRGALCICCEEGYDCAVTGEDYSGGSFEEYDHVDFDDYGPHMFGSDIDYADFDL